MSETQAAHIPSGLKVFVQQMSGYYTSVHRVEMMRQTSASSGSTISFRLPRNSLIDLNSLALHGLQTLTTGTTQVPMAEGMISRLTVRVGGEVVDEIQNYNRIFQMMYVCSGSTAHSKHRGLYNFDPLERSVVLDTAKAASYSATTGHPLDAGYIAAEALIGGVATNGVLFNRKEAQLNGTGGRQFTIDTWLGFLGMNNFLDTSNLPEIEVEIVLAGSEILGANDYSLSNLLVSCSVIKFPDYQRSLKATLLSGMTLDYNFTTYRAQRYTAPTANTNTNYNISLAGSNIKSLWFMGPKGDAAGYTNFLPWTDYFVSSRNNVNSITANINGTVYPNAKQRLDKEGVFELLRALGSKNVDVQWDFCIDNSFEYNHCSWYHRIPFEYPYSSKHELSGLNTYGSTVDCLLEVEKGANATYTQGLFLVVVEQTNILHIGAEGLFRITK